MRSYLLVVLLFSALFFYCSTETSNTYTVEVINGVRHVHNVTPLWGNEPEIGLEFVRKIGGMDETDEQFIFHRLKDLTKDKNGNHYLLDTGNYRIQQFDKDWNYIRTIGRKGDGYGEFTVLTCIDIYNDENLYIGDAGGKIHKMSISTGLDEIIRINSTDNRELFVLSNGNIIISSKEMAKQIGFGQLKPLVVLYEPTGSDIKRFVEPTLYEDNQTTSFQNYIHITIDRHDNIFVSFRNQNRIEKYSSNGLLLLSIDRQLNYEVVPEIRESPTVFKQVSTFVSGGIGIDNKDRIWVCTYIKQPQNPGTGSLDNFRNYSNELYTSTDLQKLEIFDKDGILLGKIPLSINVLRFRIFDNSIYFIPWEGVEVYEYRIVEK
ncbi:6-bladed beta-propeller [candidate division KSB1 bacterium]